MNVIKLVQKALDANVDSFSYEELLTLFATETGNFSPSSFEKFLSFSYGLKIFEKKGRKNERLYHFDKIKAQEIIDKWGSK